MSNNNNIEGINWERIHLLLEEQTGDIVRTGDVSEDEQNLLKEIIEIRTLAGDLKGWEGVDTAADLAKLRAKLSLPASTPVIIPMWRRVLRYAAVIAVPLAMAGSIAWWLFNRQAPPSVKADSYITMEVAKNKTEVLNLPDGSTVWLNAGSRLRYPAAFSGAERMVEMNGEAYFSIAANAKQPFVVKVNKQLVQVLGTTFNVNAYGGNILTTLETGKIAVSVNGGSLQYLSPGQQSAYDTLTGQLQITAGNPTAAVAWKSGQLAFMDIPFYDLMKQLGILYDYEIIFKTDKFNYLHYNVPLMSKPENITPLLQLIKATTASDIYFDIDSLKRTIEIR